MHNKTLIALLLVLSACAPKQINPDRDLVIEIVHKHNLVAQCLFDAKKFEDIKVCLTKKEEAK